MVLIMIIILLLRQPHHGHFKSFELSNSDSDDNVVEDHLIVENGDHGRNQYQGVNSCKSCLTGYLGINSDIVIRSNVMLSTVLGWLPSSLLECSTNLIV